MPEATSSTIQQQDGKRILQDTLILGGVTSLLLAIFLPTLMEMTVYWEGDQYSHGFLVPIFAMMLLWLRRIEGEEPGFAENGKEKVILGISLGCFGAAAALAWGGEVPVLGSICTALGGATVVAVAFLFCAGLLVLGLSAMRQWRSTVQVPLVPAWQRWAGVGLLTAGLGFWLFCCRSGYDVPSIYAFLPCLAGAALLAVGWQTGKWMFPAILFLVFMFPLPWTIEQQLLAPLQSIARSAATIVLQTVGIPAYSVGGNTILVDGQALDVVEQCSGLRMTTIFLALSVAFVFVVRRPWWQSAVILLSAIPIALTVNVVRITVTGIAYSKQLSHETLTLVHDWAGIGMIFLALLILWLLVTTMGALFREEEDEPLSMVGP